MDLEVTLSGMIRSAKLHVHLLKDPQSGSREPHESVEIIRMHLKKHEVSEEVQTVRGEAFNWYGYHISVLDSDFRNGMIEIEITHVSCCRWIGLQSRSEERRVGKGGGSQGTR